MDDAAPDGEVTGGDGDDDDSSLVAAPDELLTQVNRVSLNPTWDIERVRAHHSDSHGYFDLFLSAGHNGCIMCQSAGC